jgi:hypothetical protein
MNFSLTILFVVLVGVASGQRPQLLRVTRILDLRTTTDNATSEAEHLQSSFFDQKVQA